MAKFEDIYGYISEHNEKTADEIISDEKEQRILNIIILCLYPC